MYLTNQVSAPKTKLKWINKKKNTTKDVKMGPIGFAKCGTLFVEKK